MKTIIRCVWVFALTGPAIGQVLANKPKGETNPAAEALYAKAEQLMGRMSEPVDLDQAIDVLQKIVRDHPRTTTATFAMSDLARIYARKKDLAKELEWLKKCANGVRTSVSPYHKDRMDGGDPRGSAIRQLAWHSELKGDWKEALRWWTDYKPQSWCDTCQRTRYAARALSIARCQINLKEH